MAANCPCGKKYCNHIPTPTANTDAKYNTIAKKFKQANPYCRVRIIGLCSHYTTDIHHKAGRTGELLYDTQYFLPVCRACHEWVETHPEAAKKRGFSINRVKNN